VGRQHRRLHPSRHDALPVAVTWERRRPRSRTQNIATNGPQGDPIDGSDLGTWSSTWRGTNGQNDHAERDKSRAVTAVQTCSGPSRRLQAAVRSATEGGGI
jgi:hypothetical protein